MSTFLLTLPEKVSERLVILAKDEMRKGGKYDPCTTENFWEAMNEISTEQMEKVSGLMRNAEFIAATAALNLIAYDYWFEYACRLLCETAIEQLEVEAADRELMAH